MSGEAEKGTCCCVLPIPGLRMLTFPDGSQAGVIGLDDILAAVYGEGRQINADTAEEIVEKLTVKNYIASSARERYRELLMKKYRKYVESRIDSSPTQSVTPVGAFGNKKMGLFARLLRRVWTPVPRADLAGQRCETGSTIVSRHELTLFGLLGHLRQTCRSLPVISPAGVSSPR